MILGVGTDIVQIDRFKSWKDFSREQFLRVFSETELADCTQNGSYDLQVDLIDFSSLAVRFAAKEALFKALSAALVKLDKTKNEFSFLFLCKQVQVGKSTWDVPIFKINWAAIEEKIQTKLPPLSINLSLSHEKEYAVAVVFVSTD